MVIHEQTYIKKNFIYLLHISDIAHKCRWRAQRARVRDNPRAFYIWQKHIEPSPDKLVEIDTREERGRLTTPLVTLSITPLPGLTIVNHLDVAIPP